MLFASNQSARPCFQKTQNFVYSKIEKRTSETIFFALYESVKTHFDDIGILSFQIMIVRDENLNAVMQSHCSSTVFKP